MPEPTEPRKDVAIGIVLRGGKVLICQRRQNDSFGGYWEFPGGKRQLGETPEQCLRRELMEELAISIETAAALAPIDHDYPTVRVRLLPYLCRHQAGEPRPLACEKILWIEPNELRDYRFPEANRPLIEEVILRLRSIDFTPGAS